jgi:MGT family glycosyltransferase
MTAANVDETSYCRIAVNTLAATRSFYEQSIPDVVVYDYLALAARLLAHRTNALAVNLSVDPAFKEEYLHEQICVPKFRETALALSAGADRFLAEHGIESSGYLFHRNKLNVFQYPKEFEPSKHAIDESCIYAGRCPGEQVGFGEWSKPIHNNDAPTILVAPSRSYARGRDYFEMCAAAFTGLPWHVVLSISDNADASELLPLPSNFEIIKNVHHTKILPHADVVLGMGGFITSAEAAYHGVPLVMTSCGEVEVEWACENLARIGIGIHLRKENTDALALREAAFKVLDGADIRERMMRLQRSVRASPGAEEVANRIEQLLIDEGRYRGSSSQSYQRN